MLLPLLVGARRIVSTMSDCRTCILDVFTISMVCIDGFSPTFVSSAFWDKDELFRCWVKRSRSQLAGGGIQSHGVEL